MNNPEFDLSSLLKEKKSLYRIQIRKQKTDEILNLKRRNCTTMNMEPSNSNNENIDQLITNFEISLQKGDTNQAFFYLNSCRKLIAVLDSENTIENMEIIISREMVKKLVFIISCQYMNDENLIAESSWCLSNLAASKSEHVQILIKEKTVETMKNLFYTTEYPSIIDNCLYFFGNLSGENLELRDYFLDEKFLARMTKVFDDYKELNVLMRTYMWALFCISRGKPYPSFTHFKSILYILKYMLYNEEIEILKYTLTLLIYASDGGIECIQEIMNLEIIDKLVNLINTNPLNISIEEVNQIKILILRIFNNLSYGSDKQTLILVNKGLIQIIYDSLINENRTIKKIASFTLSNIMCSEPYQVQCCLNYPNLITQIISMIHQEPDEISNECIYCLTNSTFKSSAQQIDFLVENGILNIFHETLLKSQISTDLIDEILQAIINILNCGDCNLNNNINLYKEKLELCGFRKVIDKLQVHSNNTIAKRAILINDSFFGGGLIFEI